jgi:hypothetical protein
MIFPIGTCSDGVRDVFIDLASASGPTARVRVAGFDGIDRHCEEQSDEAIHGSFHSGLLRRFAPRNDGTEAPFERLMRNSMSRKS